MNLLKQLLLSIILLSSFPICSFGQANPFVNIIPSNSGIVTTGGTIDVYVTIGNTGPISGIPKAKLRPVIQVPTSVQFLPNAQQNGLPTGWTILSNTGSQIRVCNTNDSIPINTLRIITLKATGVTVAPPQTVAVNINFGNGTTCAAGTSVAGDLITDNSALTTIEVLAGCNLGVTATASPIICNGDSTNVICNVTNATGAVEYNISGNSNFQSSNVFTVPAGTYTVTAREVLNPIACVISTTITITEPDALPVTTASIVNPTCTNSLGTVLITSDTTGLTYSVDGGSFAPHPASGYQLSSGTHFITAKNSANCSPAVLNFTIDAQPPTPLVPTVDTIIQPSCSISTGLVKVSNLPSGQWIINPGNISGSGSTYNITNLAPGTYNFSVTNNFGCTSANVAPIVINTVLGAPLAPVVNVIQPTCTSALGSIEVVSPDPNLLYSLDGAAFSAYPVGGYIGMTPGNHSLIAQQIVGGCLSPFTNITIDPQPLSPSMPLVSVTQPTCTISTGQVIVLSDTTDLVFSFDGLPFSSYPIDGYTANSGSHSLAVQNSSGCAPTVLNNIIINPQPQTPTVTTSATPITCYGAYSTITANATGGILPYEFSLNDTLYQSANTFLVPAGYYKIFVKDSNGCLYVTDTITLTEPLPITGTVTATPINCNGDSSIVTVTASGGLGVMEYSVNGGLYQASNVFKLPAGEYTFDIRLKDDPACYANTSPKITISEPLKLNVVTYYEAIKYCGDSTVVTVSANGGVPPYSGLLGDFVKWPGVWTFSATDANGCVATTNVTLLPPGCVELNIYPNPAFNNVINVDHSAAISTGAHFQVYAENGAKVLQLEVPKSSFYTTIDISNLSKGLYLLVYNNGKENKVAKFIKMGK